MDNQQQPIVIIGAMEQELQILRTHLTNEYSEQIGTTLFYQGLLNNIPVVLTLSGIGKVNAAMATALVIQHYHPRCIINTGSAGGLGQGLKIGDVIIGQEIAYHDVDLTAFGYVKGQIPKQSQRFLSDKPMLNLAFQAAQSFEGAQVRAGLIVSGDQFVHGQAELQRIRQEFSDVQAVEMEAAAIAHVCTQFSLPFVIIRAISDAADEHADCSFEQFLQVASQQSAKMVMQLVCMIG